MYYKIAIAAAVLYYVRLYLHSSAIDSESRSGIVVCALRVRALHSKKRPRKSQNCVDHGFKYNWTPSKQASIPHFEYRSPAAQDEFETKARGPPRQRNHSATVAMPLSHYQWAYWYRKLGTSVDGKVNIPSDVYLSFVMWQLDDRFLTRGTHSHKLRRNYNGADTTGATRAGKWNVSGPNKNQKST